MNLGNLIKAEIKRQGKTQKEVANGIGISTNAICQICINATFPQKETLEKICEYLNVEIDYTIKNIECSNTQKIENLVCKGKCEHGYNDEFGNELFCSIKEIKQIEK